MSEAKELINELLVVIFNRILAIESEALRISGVALSMNEVHVLEAISMVNEPSMTTIATKLGITVGSLTTSINTLVQKGYVKRNFSPTDRRKVLVSLEAPASEVLIKHHHFHEKMIDGIFEDLKIDEDEILLQSLRRVATYFTK